MKLPLTGAPHVDGDPMAIASLLIVSASILLPQPFPFAHRSLPLCSPCDNRLVTRLV